jgi:hypothetical protein
MILANLFFIGFRIKKRIIKMQINHTCTAREMSIIRKYITGLSYKLKMTQDELDSFHKIRTRKQLEKKSYEYIAKKLDIPSEILPPLVQVEADEHADYSYAFLDNVIQAGIKLRTPKTEILSAIRHEFQHFLQICNMLRTEGLGSEAQKYLTQESIEDRKDFITMLIKKSNFKIFDPKECPDGIFFNGLRNALHINDMNLFNERFKPAAEDIKNMWQTIRTVAINHWGVIKQGTYEAKTNKELFEDLKKHKPDEDIFDWAISKLEKDAMLAEDVAYREYNKIDPGCYIKKEKQIYAALEKDELYQELQKIALDRQKKKEL